MSKSDGYDPYTRTIDLDFWVDEVYEKDPANFFPRSHDLVQIIAGTSSYPRVRCEFRKLKFDLPHKIDPIYKDSEVFFCEVWANFRRIVVSLAERERNSKMELRYFKGGKCAPSPSGEVLPFRRGRCSQTF